MSNRSPIGTPISAEGGSRRDGTRKRHRGRPKGDSSGWKSERAGIRVLNKRRFTALDDIGEVAKILFLGE